MRGAMKRHFRKHFLGGFFPAAGSSGVDFPARFKNRTMLTVGICLIQLVFCVALAGASEGAEGAHEGRNWADFGWRFFDFVALAGGLYWLLAEKTKDFFSGRRESLKAALEGAETAKQEAAAKLSQSKERLAKAAEEIRDATESIRVQGLREKERIVADARRAAEKMKDDARKRLDQELRKASSLLKAEAVDLSLKLSEEILRKNIGVEDHNAMVADYIGKIPTEGRLPKQ